MIGALPPSSRWSRLTVSAAIRATRLPVTVSPVIETMRTFGWPTSASPMSAPEPDRTLTTPGGRTSARISAKASAVSGVRADGLSTTVLPVASAGPSFQLGHVERVVPRRDRGDDADRVAPDDRGVAGQELVGRQAVHDPRRAGEEAEQVDARRPSRRSRRRPACRRSALSSRPSSSAFASSVSAILSRSRERSCGRRLLPGLERLRGGFDRAVDVLRGAGRDVGDDLVVGRVDDIGRLARRRRRRTRRR